MKDKILKMIDLIACAGVILLWLIFDHDFIKYFAFASLMICLISNKLKTIELEKENNYSNNQIEILRQIYNELSLKVK